MARKNRGSGEGDSRKRSSEEGRKNYESSTYGDYDDGGYDDDGDEDDDYAFESGYDDEDYADYDTSFDEDDGSWGRRQEQFEGATRDERRRKAQVGSRNTYRRDVQDHTREFDEGYNVEFETDFDEADESDNAFVKRGRGLASMPRGRARRITTKASKRRRPSGTKGSTRKETTGKKISGKTDTRANSRKRSSSASSLRTRSNGASRKAGTGTKTTRRRMANSGKKVTSTRRSR